MILKENTDNSAPTKVDSKMKEEKSLTTKVARYAKVSTAVGSLATRLAGQKYLGIGIDRDAHAQGLKEVVGGLKGPLMKIFQFLATIPDALPPEYANEFLELQSNAPPMGWNFVKRRMRSELGSDWQKFFSHFDREPSASASLGQVHFATGLAGEEFACKLQYPDMASVVEADLAQLRLALSVYENFSKALETNEVQAEIKERLEEELDYTFEAANMKMFDEIFANCEFVHIPKVYSQLSTNRLLTMSWLEGKGLFDILDQPDGVLNNIAGHMFHGWYYPFYSHGVIHGDPHTGNYTFCDDGTVNILDFGCIRVFPPKFVKGVVDLYHAMLNDDQELAVYAYETWGFANLTKEIIEIISEWAKLLYDPLLDDRVRPIQAEHSGEKGWQTATQVHDRLQKAGGIRPPKEFVFMDRAAVGIGSVMMRLRVEMNWHRMFEELIADFSPMTLQQNQQHVAHSRVRF